MSNASRSSYKFYNDWGLWRKQRNLSIFKKWSAGRNDSGQIVFRTRGSLNQRSKSVKINHQLRYNKLGFIAHFQLIPVKNKLLTMMYYPNGTLSYYTTSEFHRIFSFSLLNLKPRLRRFSLKPYFLWLSRVKKLSFVSSVELVPGKGAQYARSSGTFCKVIRFDPTSHSALLKLPSGVKKLFSYYSFASIGRTALSEHARCAHTKSGYWRGFGFKSIVRGVAMNPVDHPHGGRTKTVKYPRTPWGKTTKFK